MAKRVSIAERQLPKKALAASVFMPETAREGLVMVSPRDLQPNPYQPRGSFNEEHLKELANSVTQDGIIEPIVVRPHGNGKYQIIAGERRWRAAQIAKLRQLPAIINDCSDEDMELLALEENLHREDLNDVDRGRALKSIKSKRNLTWEQLGKRVGLSRRRVLMLAGLANLPEDIQKQIAQGKLTEKHSRSLNRLKGHEQQRQFLEVVQREKLSGDRAIAVAKRLQEDPSGDIQRAVEAVVKPITAPSEHSRSVRVSQAAAQFKKALDAVHPDNLSAAERQCLATELHVLIVTAQRAVEQLNGKVAK